MTEIHPSAVVDSRAELAADVYVGPYCVVGAEVCLEEGVRLEAHVVLGGDTALGAGCRVFPFGCLGQRPQDLKYRGEASELRVGAGNQIREHVTMQPGTAGGGGLTRVGDGGLFMAGVHIAHDCQVGSGVVMANNATLGGHVEAQDFACLGGLAAVHQFVRVGRHAMVGGLAGVEHDVIPYGLKRHAIARDEVHSLRTAYRLLFAPEGAFAERPDDVASEFAGHSRVIEIVDELEREGFQVVGADELLASLHAPAGLMTRTAPSSQAERDIALGITVARRLGELDVGQAVVVQHGLVLGVEAAEGTDRLLARCAELRPQGDGGVLVKLKKPAQERRADLPAIGPRTVHAAAAAGLEGIAVEAGECLMIERSTLIAAADRTGLFVLGVTSAGRPTG